MEVTVDGAKVFASTGGRPPSPGSPSVVLIHGSGMDHTVWSLQTRYLAHHGRNALALDLPGHGRSAGAALESIEAYRDWLLRFLDASAIDAATLVGHSMGALIALAAAAHAPRRLRSLALLGVSPRMGVHRELLRAAREGEHAAIDLITSWGFGRAAHLGGARAPGTWMLRAGSRLLERDTRRALACDLAACDAYLDAPAAARQVRCPTLVVAGDDDRMTPATAAQELASAISGARVTVLARCGHMMMIERPDAALDALMEIA